MLHGVLKNKNSGSHLLKTSHDPGGFMYTISFHAPDNPVLEVLLLVHFIVWKGKLREVKTRFIGLEEGWANWKSRAVCLLHEHTALRIRGIAVNSPTAWFLSGFSLECLFQGQTLKQKQDQFLGPVSWNSAPAQSCSSLCISHVRLNFQCTRLFHKGEPGKAIWAIPLPLGNRVLLCWSLRNLLLHRAKVSSCQVSVQELSEASHWSLCALFPYSELMSNLQGFGNLEETHPLPELSAQCKAQSQCLARAGPLD